MPVLVTGGTGQLGVNLIRALASQGTRVRALVRPTSSRKALDLPGIEFVVGDVTDADSVSRAAAGCSHVYHLAGWVRVVPWSMQEAHAVNVEGTRNICQACIEHHVSRLVHVSSIAAIGPPAGPKPADEQTPLDVERSDIPYYRTKRDAEEIVHRYIGRGLDAVIVNPSYTVGPYDVKPTGGRVIVLVATRRLKGYPSTGGIAVVDVREVVEGMRLAMQRGMTGQRYILAGENLSHREFSNRIAAIAGVAPPRWRAPRWLVGPAARLAAAGRRAWPGLAEDFNPAIVRVSFREQYVAARKARDELGVKHWPVDRAIADALNWFEQNGYLIRGPRCWRIGPELPHV